MIISIVFGYTLLFIGVGLFNQGCASFTERRESRLVTDVCTRSSGIRRTRDPFPGETVFPLASAVRQMRELLVLKLFLEERQRAFYRVRRTVFGVVISP